MEKTRFRVLEQHWRDGTGPARCNFYCAVFQDHSQDKLSGNGAWGAF